MPARTRQASDPPTRTPSFVCEVPLPVNRAQERTLLARLEAARQVYNACLFEARTPARLVRASKAFQRARILPRDDPERKPLFARARAQHGFSDEALQAFAKAFGHSWLGEDLDSHTLQKLATRASGAANRLLLGKAKRVRFKGKQHLESVESKVNTSGIRWSGTQVEWLGLLVPALLNPRDAVLAHGRSCPVKYVRLVRRTLGLRTRISAQLVCEGVPYQKPQHQIGQGIVGLDLGPSTLAVVAEQQARLHPFCPAVTPNGHHLRRLARHLDRKLRANTPTSDAEHGRVKPGRKRWKASKRQRKTQALRREVYRKLAATRKRSHGQLARSAAGAGGYLPPGAHLLARLAKNLWSLRESPCPSRCLSRCCLAWRPRALGQVVELNTRRARLSQRCHCGAVQKKPLRQRWHVCDAARLLPAGPRHAPIWLAS